MRVISGIHKRRRFDVSHSLRAHPITNPARGNLFDVSSNYIGSEEGARTLDLFVGTGNINIEPASKGRDRVINIEKDRDHYAFIYKIIRELKTDKCLPVRGDASKYIRGGREQSDFILVDPPCGLRGFEILPDPIFENNLLKEEGLFVLEHGKTNSFESHPHFIERRVYGSANFSFFRSSKL